MAMYPCKYCLENHWSFERDENGLVIATCLYCDAEVSFFPKPKPYKRVPRPRNAYRKQDPDDDGKPPW